MYAGKSSGPRALIPDFHGLVKDFSSFAAYVRRLHPSLPLCIVAHSMGTLVTTLALESIPDVTAVCIPSLALLTFLLFPLLLSSIPLFLLLI